MCSLVLSIFSFPWNENAFSHHLMKSTWKKNDSCLFFLLHAVMKLVATKNTLTHVTWKTTIYFFKMQVQGWAKILEKIKNLDKCFSIYLFLQFVLFRSDWRGWITFRLAYYRGVNSFLDPWGLVVVWRA